MVNLQKNVSHSQTEAYLNEFKGHVFEYLVAAELAKALGLRADFMAQFAGEQAKRLQAYERTIRERDPKLYASLPLMADNTAQIILGELQTLGSESVEITARQSKLDLGESDIHIKGPHEHLISLKLGKASSFVNTKSGGLKSFLQKYFHLFPSSSLDQESVNFKLDDAFTLMGRELHQTVGESYDGDYKLWRSKGLSELPGELSEKQRQIIKQFYYKQIKFFHEFMSRYLAADQEKFLQCLYPLLGFSHAGVKQVFCYYKNEYQFHKNLFVSLDKLLGDGELQMGILKEGLSSFEINHQKFILQIRMKPMNKFTSPALKINCSVKWT